MARKKQTTADRERLRELIEEATVDCYGDEEQFMGLCNMIEEEVVVPFKAKVIGEAVTVTSLNAGNEGNSIWATCERNGKKHRVEITSLEWVKPLPEGFEWIEAYIAWREFNS